MSATYQNASCLTEGKAAPLSKPARAYLRRECLRTDEVEACRSRGEQWLDVSRGWCPLRFEAYSVDDVPGFPPFSYVTFRDDGADETVWSLERSAGKLRLLNERDRTASRSVKDVAEALEIIEATSLRARAEN